MCTEGDMAEKKKKKNLNGFGGPGWFRSLEKSYEEEGENTLLAAPLALGAGVVESDGCKAKRLVVFVEVMRVRQRFLEVDRSIIYKAE